MRESEICVSLDGAVGGAGMDRVVAIHLPSPPLLRHDPKEKQTMWRDAKVAWVESGAGADDRAATGARHDGAVY
jgi:hypothetical protein